MFQFIEIHKQTTVPQGNTPNDIRQLVTAK